MKLPAMIHNTLRALLMLGSLWCSTGLFAAEVVVEEIPEGPHGGRLLIDGDFAVELAIFEDGVEPEYHAWAYQNEEELALRDWEIDVRLTRLGGAVDQFSFVPAGEFQRGQGVVGEPHSFDVVVTARHGDNTYSWSFPSYEGRMKIAPALAEELNVETAVARPGTLRQTTLLYGKTTPDPQGTSHVSARFPGLIRSISADLGQRVEAGNALAVIEANNSLQTYTITAPIDGLVIQRHANPGEIAGDQPLLTIADYSRVWVDLDVFPGDARTIRPGQVVSIRMGDQTADSTILYLNPGEGDSPNVVARVPLDNPEGQWTPGLLVEGDVVAAEIPVPLMVNNLAIQTFRDWQVVFVNIGDAYEIRPLTLGRTDGRFTEVLEGLNDGDAYVVVNSYLIKADLEKSGAAHDH